MDRLRAGEPDDLPSERSHEIRLIALFAGRPVAVWREPMARASHGFGRGYFPRSVFSNAPQAPRRIAAC
jgi:hypothetical protein